MCIKWKVLSCVVRQLFKMFKSVLELPDEALSEVVRQTLGENEDKLNNRVELFKEWLQHEDHLPKDVDLTFVKNIIRSSKFDILEARRKFEMFMYAKATRSDFFDYTRLINDDVFKTPMHRRITNSRRLTKDGYRLLSIRFNSADAPHLCVDHMLAYTYFLGEYFLWSDFACGVMLIIDSDDFYPEFLANTNMTTFKMCVERFFKIRLVRIKNIHVCNVTPSSKVLVNVGLALLSGKMRQKVVYHKTAATLSQYIDLDDLPKEYGGTAECLEDVGVDCKKFLFDHKESVQSIVNQKLLVSGLRYFAPILLETKPL